MFTKHIKHYSSGCGILILALFLFGNNALAADPVINSINPDTAPQGSSAKISGTDLAASVRLFERATQRVTRVTGSVNTAKTEVTFTIPSSLAEGEYNVSIEVSDYISNGVPLTVTKAGDTTGTSSGSAPFQPPPRLSTPNQGLPTDLGGLISDIFTWSLRIVGIAVFVMVFYAGFLWLTAAGNTTKVNDAISKITNAAIGAILLFSAYLILYTINPDLVGGTFKLPGVGSSNTSR